MADWTDWTSEQRTPAQLVTVDSRSAVERHLREHAIPDLTRHRFRVTGSGHSTSDVGRPVAGQVLFRLARTGWKPEAADDHRFLPLPEGDIVPTWLPAGARIRELNARLAERRLAFPNLGSYDEQTLFGALTTGTHGSGMVSGPLVDSVLALDITTITKGPANTPTVRSFRVEPKAGVTRDRAEFEDLTDIEVLQSDDAFAALGVSMGCFGVVTGVVFATRRAFWLRERRTFSAWRVYRSAVGDGARADPSTHLRADLVITSLPVRGTAGDYGVLETVREELPFRRDQPPLRDDARTRAARSQFDNAGHRRLAAALELSKLGSSFPRLANHCVQQQLRADADESKEKPFESRSDRVLFSSIGDYLVATSMEVAVPIARWRDSVDAILAELRQLSKEGLHTLSPLGVRFTRASRFLLAPQAGRDTCTIETPVLAGAHRRENGHSRRDIEEILSRLEAVLVSRFDGRPHWGQRHSTSAAQLERAYGPRWATWKSQRDFFDPYGLFVNAFSERMGFVP